VSTDLKEWFTKIINNNSKTSLTWTHITHKLGFRRRIFLTQSKLLGFMQRCQRVTQTQLAWTFW